MLHTKAHIKRLISRALEKLVSQNILPESALEREIHIGEPKFKDHGDLSTSLCLQMAKEARSNPRQLAQRLVDAMELPDSMLASVEIAGPGFINFRLSDKALHDGLRRIVRAGDGWGRFESRGVKVNLEFVSANPTGPLHIGHGRGAAVGDALARIMRAAGYDVTTEYYLNDAGRQVRLLTESLWARYTEVVREQYPEIEVAALPEDGYQGAYVTDMARDFARQYGPDMARSGSPDRDLLRAFALRWATDMIMSTLSDMNVKFDVVYSEKKLHDDGKVAHALSVLRERGLLYEQDGAVYFRSTEFGDEKDRVVIRSTGEHTYFASDIAYHLDKLERGFDVLIDIWGADHHGYVPRVKAALEALGHDPDRFQVLLVQFVSLVRAGEKVSMGKRSGNFVTLQDLMDTVGGDVARWFFISKTHDVALDFDLEKGMSEDPRENPARYAQYGHARAASILRRWSEDLGRSLPDPDGVDLSRLELPEEQELIKMMMRLPEVVKSSAEKRNPHVVAAYLVDMVRLFQSYYTQYKNDPVLPRASSDPASWNWAKSEARIVWVNAFRTVTRNALTLLGLPAPDYMKAPENESDETPNEKN